MGLFRRVEEGRQVRPPKKPGLLNLITRNFIHLVTAEDLGLLT